MNRINIRSRVRGFTLVETVVAMIVLAIGVTAALACVATATKSTRVASEYTQAALFAQRRFAELAAQPDQVSTGEQSGDFSPDNPDYRWHQSLDTTDVQSVLKVTVNVEWSTGLSKRSSQFVTYIPNPQTASNTQTGANGTTTGP